MKSGIAAGQRKRLYTKVRGEEDCSVATRAKDESTD